MFGGVRLSIRAEDLIGQLLLLLRHRVVEVFESREEFLQALSVDLSDLLIGSHVLQSVHGRVLLHSLRKLLIHAAGVLPHNVGKLLPLRLLSRSNLQLRAQFLYVLLDTLFRIARNFMRGHGRGRLCRCCRRSVPQRLIGLSRDGAGKCQHYAKGNRTYCTEHISDPLPEALADVAKAKCELQVNGFPAFSIRNHSRSKPGGAARSSSYTDSRNRPAVARSNNYKGWRPPRRQGQDR